MFPMARLLHIKQQLSGKNEINTGIMQALGDGLSITNYFSLDGQSIERPRKGLNIVRVSNGTVKKVIVK